MSRLAEVARSQRALFAVGLVLTLVLAAALRLYGVKWGLPDAAHPDYSYHPDETLTIIWARWLVAGEIIPKHFMYGGTLHYSMLNAYYYFGNLLSPVLGGINWLANTMLIGRYFVVGISLLTIVLVYSIGHRLFDRLTGLIGALLLAVSPVHVFLAQSVRPDEVATFLAMLQIFVAVRIFHANASADRYLFALAGAAVGASVAFRLPLAVFAVAPCAAYVLRERMSGTLSILARLIDQRLAILAVTVAITYAVLSPHTFIYLNALIDGLLVTWQYESSPFADAVDRGPGVYQYGWLMLREALGAPVYWLALGGVAWACWRRTPAQLLILISIIPYFVAMTMASWVVVRYTLPIVPLLVLLAAATIVEGARLWAGRYRYVVYALACVAVAWTFLADVAFLKVETGKNVREVVSDWIQHNAPKGAAIATAWQYDGDVYSNPVIPPGYQHYALQLVRGADPSGFAQDRAYDYLILNQEIYQNMERLGPRHPRPEIVAFQQTLQRSRYRLLQEFTQPVEVFGIDFSNYFKSQDFVIINPGLRVYRYE